MWIEFDLAVNRISKACVREGKDRVHTVLKYKQNAFGMVNVPTLPALVALFAKCRIHASVMNTGHEHGISPIIKQC